MPLLIRQHGDDRHRANPFAALRVTPVFPQTANRERRMVFHRDGEGCFARAPLIAHHSKKQSTGTMQRRLA